jgi:hypothetical protein
MILFKRGQSPMYDTSIFLRISVPLDEIDTLKNPSSDLLAYLSPDMHLNSLNMQKVYPNLDP